MTVHRFSPARPRRVALVPEVHLGAALAAAWRKSTHFALTRRCGLVVDASELITPTPALRRTQRAVQKLGLSAAEMMWVKAWPGTRTRANGVLWIRASSRPGPSFTPTDALLWNGFDGWEDLQLFDGNRLLLFVCSHEGFGMLWVEAGFAQEGLRAKPAAEDLFEVEGKLVSPRVAEALIRPIG